MIRQVGSDRFTAGWSKFQVTNVCDNTKCDLAILEYPVSKNLHFLIFSVVCLFYKKAVVTRNSDHSVCIVAQTVDKVF